MATREVVQCDNGTCKSIKKESNNWVRAWRYDFGILITPFDLEPPKVPGIKIRAKADLCGAGCCIEYTSKWLDENVKNEGAK